MAACVGGGLREKLESVEYPGGEDPQVKQIIPLDEIEKHLGEEEIVRLLTCGCQQHKLRASENGISSSADARTLANTILGKTPGRGREDYPAIKILALLILVNQSHWIIDLFMGGIRDPQWDSLTEKKLLKLTKNMMPSTGARSISLKKWSLNPPFLSHPFHEKFDKNIIMPFKSNRLIGEGSSGKVYEIEIHPTYQKLILGSENEPVPQQFARKELIRHNKAEFDTEKENLSFVQKLRDEHLIKILKTYQHGENLNFLFPLADCSLHDYLERQPPEGDVVSSPFWTHWLWDQLAGVAGALDKISSFQEGEEGFPNSYRKWFGYHLDLKPLNILVTSKNGKRTLVITDFGQAYFKRINKDNDSYSAIPANYGGTVYAPPDGEINPNGQISRSFDVWSFGCILLEAAIYITQGTEGHKSLRDFREKKSEPIFPGSVGIAAWFYNIVESDGKKIFKIKKAVSDQIKYLKDEINHPFMNGIMKLVEATFNHQDKRPIARDVTERLRGLLSGRSTDSDVQSQHTSIEVEHAMTLSTQSDENFGHDRLKNMKLRYTFSDPGGDCRWFDCRVTLQRNKKLEIIKVHTHGKEVLSQLVVIQKLLLLDPLYVQEKYKDQLGFKGFNLRYQFCDIEDLKIFQSILTNQDILVDLEVEKISVESKDRSSIWVPETTVKEDTQYHKDGAKCGYGLRIQLWSPHPLSLTTELESPDFLRSFSAPTIDTSEGTHHVLRGRRSISSFSSLPETTRTRGSSARTSFSTLAKYTGIQEGGSGSGTNTPGSTRRSSTPVGTSRAGRPPRKAPKPPDRFARIVIYLKCEIMIIRVDDLSDVLKEANRLYICPRQGKSFLAYRIKDPEGKLPGIPTCEDLINEQEDQEKYGKKIAHIRVAFPAPKTDSTAADCFIDHYNSAYREFMDEAERRYAIATRYR